MNAAQLVRRYTKADRARDVSFLCAIDHAHMRAVLVAHAAKHGRTFITSTGATP